MNIENIHKNNICINYAFIKELYKLEPIKFDANIKKYLDMYNNYLDINFFILNYNNDPIYQYNDIDNIVIILFDDDNIIIIKDNKIKYEDNTIKLIKTYDDLYELTNLEYKIFQAYDKKICYLILFKNNRRKFRITNLEDFCKKEKYNLKTKDIDVFLTISFIELYLNLEIKYNKIELTNNIEHLVKYSNLNNNIKKINLDKENIFINKATFIPDNIDYIIHIDKNDVTYYTKNISITYYNKYIYFKDNIIYILKSNFIELLCEFINNYHGLTDGIIINPNDNNQILIVDVIYIYIISDNLQILENASKINYNNQEYNMLYINNFIDILIKKSIISEDSINGYYKLRINIEIMHLGYIDLSYMINNYIKKVIKNFKIKNKNINVNEIYNISIYDNKLENKYCINEISLDNIYILQNINKYVYIEYYNKDEYEEKKLNKIINIIYTVEESMNNIIKGGRNKKFKVFYNDKNKKYYINNENRKRYLSYKNTYKEKGKFYMKLKKYEIEIYS